MSFRVHHMEVEGNSWENIRDGETYIAKRVDDECRKITLSTGLDESRRDVRKYTCGRGVI